jgi:hypothetical protein
MPVVTKKEKPLNIPQMRVLLNVADGDAMKGANGRVAYINVMHILALLQRRGFLNKRENLTRKGIAIVKKRSNTKGTAL